MNTVDHLLFCYHNGEISSYFTHQPMLMETRLRAEFPRALFFSLPIPPQVEGEYDILDELRNPNPNASLTLQKALREGFISGARAEKGKKGELSDLMLVNLLNMALGDLEKDDADLGEILRSRHVSPALVSLLQEAWKLGQQMIQKHPDSPLEKSYYILFSLEGATLFSMEGKNHVDGGHLVVHATGDLDHKEGELRKLYSFLPIKVLPCNVNQPGMEAMIALLEESNLHVRTDGRDVVGSWIKDTLGKAFMMGAACQRESGISCDDQVMRGLLLTARRNHPELASLPGTVDQVFRCLMEEAWQKGAQFADDHPEVNVNEM